MKFHTKIELGGKTATGMEVPSEIVAALGSSKKPAVKVTINGYTYRSTVATMGGKFILPVSAEVRAAAGIAARDAVAVEFEAEMIGTAPSGEHRRLGSAAFLALENGRARRPSPTRGASQGALPFHNESH